MFMGLDGIVCYTVLFILSSFPTYNMCVDLTAASDGAFCRLDCVAGYTLYFILSP